MAYNISQILGRLKVTSPFGKKVRPMEDTGLGGKKVVVGPGKSVPDIIRDWFSTNDIVQVRAPHLAFADRDRKERTYDPGTDDPYTFKGNNSLSEFNADALEIIAFLNERWKKLGLPSKFDDDLKVDVPDSESLLELSGYEKYKDVIEDNLEEIMLITSNIDIAFKFNIVRTITTGWWIQSYSGQDNPNIAEFDEAFQIFEEVYDTLYRLPSFRQNLRELEEEAGDPLTTNSGYPYFSAEMDDKGRPVAKVKTVNLFEGIGLHLQSVDKLLTYVKLRTKGMALSVAPLACACIRRLQYGKKWAHIFKISSFGLQSVDDVRGYNTVRVAWMVPYVLNLIISPLQRLWKTTRKLIVGMYREGAVINLENQYIRKNPASMHYVAEADYSNYDRTIARNMILKINDIITKHSPRRKFWNEIVNFIHTSIPLLWPDYLPHAKGVVWAFRGKIIGLLSGLKITSEEGTLFNLIVNIKAMLIEGYSQQEIVKYLTVYKNGLKSTNIILRIQSDDTLLSRASFPDLIRACEAFKKAAKLAGLKSSVSIGDRYLMRHMYEGKDTPVLARIFQNTLSNEEPVSDHIKFAVGFAMRTDGLLGHKTIVANSQRTGFAVTEFELTFTILVLGKLLRFMKSATHPVTDAIQICELIISEAEMMRASKRYVASSEFIGKVDRMRRAVVHKLALLELQKSKAKLNYESYLAELLKDASRPSTQVLLEQLTQLSPELKNLVDKFVGREHTFYVYAMNKLKLKTDDY